MGEFESRSVKTQDRFHLFENSHKLFSQTGYGDIENRMFNFFYKVIISSLNKEKDDVQSAYCKFSQLGATVNHVAALVETIKIQIIYYPN